MSLSLQIKKCHLNQGEGNEKEMCLLQPKPASIKWNEKFNSAFISALSTPVCQEKIDTFLNVTSNIDCMLEEASDIVNTAANIANIRKTKAKSKRKKTHNKKWFDDACRSAYKILKHLGSQLHKNPFAEGILLKYRTQRKAYKKLLKQKKKAYETEFIQKLEDNNNNN